MEMQYLSILARYVVIRHLSDYPIHSGWIELNSSMKDVCVYIRHRYLGLLEVCLTLKIAVNGGDITFIIGCIATALFKHALMKISTFTKFHILYTIHVDAWGGKVTFTLGKAITLTDKDGMLHPRFLRDLNITISSLAHNGHDSSKAF